MKKVALLPLSKEWDEAKVKILGVILLALEISKQPLFWVSVVWSLVVSVMKIYTEEQQKQEGKTQNVQFEEKEYQAV